MAKKTVGEVAFKDLRIGDKIISCAGRDGVIAGIYPYGSFDPTGVVSGQDDYGPSILMLWHGDIKERGSWSIAGTDDLKVEYLGRPEHNLIVIEVTYYIQTRDKVGPSIAEQTLQISDWLSFHTGLLLVPIEGTLLDTKLYWPKSQNSVYLGNSWPEKGTRQD
jgi:hypothetical protein